MFRASNKEAREIGKWLRELGWQYIGHSGSDHDRFDHPEYGLIDIAHTASVPQKKAALAEMGRLMGITKLDVEVRLGIATRRRHGPKVKRTRNEAGRQARRFEVVRDEGPGEPVRVGTPQERLKAIVRDRLEAEGRQARAEVASDEYRCALDDISRCRREYLTVELELKEAA